jgi:dipeptidyl aminopeptidase/acylaminoacyl peptidase
MKKHFILILSFTLLFFSTQASENDSIDNKIPIQSFLKAGNFSIFLPSFDTIENIKGKKFEQENLLKFSYLDISGLNPEENQIFRWNDNKSYKWTKISSDKDGFVFVNKKKNKSCQIAYYSSYMETNRWLKANLEIESPQMFEAWLDGKLILSKYSFDKEDAKKIGKKDKELIFENGKHSLIIKTFCNAENVADWKFSATITPSDEFEKENIIVSTSLAQFMDIEHVLEGKRVNSANISPSGELVIIRFSETNPPKGKTKNWIEIHNLTNGSIIRNFRNAKIWSMKWSPDGNKISYVSSGEKGNTLWISNLTDGTDEIILENIEDFGSYKWSPDGSLFIYSISEKPEKNSSGVKKFEGMPDRWPWWRNRQFLYKVDVRSKIRQRLTYGKLSTNLHDISPDGKKIIFSQSIPDFSERPYSKQILFSMNLKTLKTDTIWKNKYSGSVSYSPDGKKLLITGGPLLFGNIGNNVTNGKTPNDYDTQAYIYNLKAKKAEAISLKFKPSINQVFWNKFDKQIYFLACDKTYTKVFKYDLKEKTYTKIPVACDVVKNVSFADEKPTAVYTGTSISTPVKAFAINLENNENKTIAFPEKDFFKNVNFGKTEEWNFKNKEGIEIDGRIYFPPNFDKNKKYPLIVYYYGGTSPTIRSFGGRYPKNLFASHGFIVYVLQPSGATGYGQNFSAMHVNNWGITVADEIINGTKQFCKEHSFIDETKIGCMGASYGGFMTMLLTTRTDIFAAAISHAGISSISSYWGEGYWGYLYSSVATANSFPWNNKEIYIEQSPLFNADKISTPLLLLHGSNDTNVPPGESIQLYTALKLLGKPVEFIEIKGQNHHILDYKKRILWQKTIMAWFAKYLKEQTEWWNDLYPKNNF